ncbi:hypothetical protein PIB30_006009 [Stylosanthes scabra]|uniref:Uncharacterized protein n=1 Tax=Stylosanthes scabra TaxID=79078 RepID=A0ABU6T507_9FABA|nr:hypothetical protein [Stylosanthes scabra]
MTFTPPSFPTFLVGKIHTEFTGKVFIYWLGTEPFLYIAEPELVKKMSTHVMAKCWGKPNVFKDDRYPMFGTGLVMAEGHHWVRHRHLIAPAFSPLNLKSVASRMVDCANEMIMRWSTQINNSAAAAAGGNGVIIDVEKEIIETSGEIIAKTCFGGTQDEDAKQVLQKLRALQTALFKSTRYVGVPFGRFFNVKKTLEANKLGAEIDRLLFSVIRARKESKNDDGIDLLGLLMNGGGGGGGGGVGNDVLTEREVVDECKTFFFGGHETTALAITWTLMLLALHPHWQIQLRHEIFQLLPHHNNNPFLHINLLSRLKKMQWVMNEALRLYPPAPNVQRQAREDIQIEGLMVPKGTNMWIDVVAMHHDKELWGEDANEFKPERFMEDVNGGCKHKMGYLPFGFGGRMCVGRNLTFMEYKIVLTLVLSKFSFKLSTSYHHSPSIMLSLRPSHGLPLVVQPL